MKLGFIILNLLYLFSASENNNKSEIIPKELIDGKIQNDTWEAGKFYEYYLDISNYKLNEENIFEIYRIKYIMGPGQIKLYLLLTDISDVELIKNGTIKPDHKKDIYSLNDTINIKYDRLNYDYYLFIPFKKTSASQKFLIISIENILQTQIEALFYISKRIPTIDIDKKNQVNTFAYSKEIEVKDDIRLYYKIDLRKVDLIKNNVYIFIKMIENNERVVEVNYYNNFSLPSSIYNMFIIEKNKQNFSEIYFGIKRVNDYNKIKYVNLSIRIDDNTFYLIQNEKRRKKKLFIQDIKCEKNIFIIEDYIKDDFYNDNYQYLTNVRLYGNYSIKNYKSIKDLNFEKFDKENNEDISNTIIQLTGYVNVYILKCVSPSAFYLEIFYLNDGSTMQVGDSIKRLFFPDRESYRYIYFTNLKISEIYKFYVEIYDDYPFENRTLDCWLFYLNQYNFTRIKEPDKYYSEIFYYNYYWTYIVLSSYDYMYINYYLTSNHLFHNIVEGKTKINKNIPNLALKIKRDFYLDYIKIEVKCETNIKGYYELKLVNNRDIEDESNAVMVGLPQVAMPLSTLINLNISNPYNKYDQNYYVDEKDNFYYLLFSFEITEDKPIYIDIEYIHNDQSITLHSLKSEIIIPQKEYEFFSYSGDYKTKDKILFNINKCNNLANFTLVNYYENNENIISKVPIVEPHQTILIDNYHYKGKFIITKESGKEKVELNESLIFPANYYHKGDILLNFFSIESSKLKEIKFNNDFSISYEEETWDNITFKWNHYAFRESNNNKMNIPTNYSIYVLPKNSVVNTICQLHLIPSNKSVINTNEVAIELKEGEYKISIIAKIIDNDIPFEIRYDTLELKVVKKMNLILIIFLGVFGLAFILFILFIIFWKKKILMFKKRRELEINGEDDIADSVDNIMKENSEEEEEEADDDESSKNTLAKKLIEMIDK